MSTSKSFSLLRDKLVPLHSAIKTATRQFFDDSDDDGDVDDDDDDDI